MSFRNLFAAKVETHSRKRRAAHAELIPAQVERLETRALLSAIAPGLNQHGVVFTNANVAGRTSVTFDGSINPQISNNANGAGLFIDINGSTSLRQLTLSGLQARNNGSAGAIVNLSNLQLDLLVVDASAFAENGTAGSGAGLVLQLNNAHIGQIVITNSRFNLNEFDGLHLTTAAGSTIQSLRVLNNRAAQNATADGMAFLMNNSSVQNLGFGNNILRENGTNGFQLKLTNTPVRNLLIRDNVADANVGGHGVFLDFIGSAVTTQILRNQLINQQAGDGFRIRTQFSGAGLRNINLAAFSDNTFEANAGNGFFATLARDTTIRTPLGGGVFANQFLSNGGVGFGVTAVDTENAVDLQIGSLTRQNGVLIQANTFDQNTGAAIVLTLQDPSGELGDTTGRVRILGNTITATNAGSLPFTGEGILIRAQGSTVLTNGAARWSQVRIDGNTIRNNAGHGVMFDITEDSQLIDAVVGNNTGSKLRFDVNGAVIPGSNPILEPNDGNVIEDNGGNGITLARRDSAVVRHIRVLDNLIRRNQNGVGVLAQNTFVAVPNAATQGEIVTHIEINNNQLRDNRANGISVRTEADAVLLANIKYNYIDGNAGNGIRSSGFEANDFDRESIGGVWVKNRISNNDLHGITIENPAGTINPLLIGRDGFDTENEPFELNRQSLGNFIFRNGESGINITSNSPGSTVRPQEPNIGENAISIINNDIVENGRNAFASGPLADPYTAGKGIDIEVLQGRQGGPRDYRNIIINRNRIEENAGDGVEIRSAGGVLDLIAIGNVIDGNGGRGVDVLNQTGSVNFSPDSNILFGSAGFTSVDAVNQTTGAIEQVNRSNGNILRSNGLEGFYVVNTADAAQTQDVSARTTLLDGGRKDVNLGLVLNIENNDIRDNGLGTPATVVRDPSTVLSTNGLILRAGTSSAGGIQARVNGNAFSGNAGDDVYVGHFRSTVDPNTTNGDWTSDKFVIRSQEADPLARIALVFTNNSGDSLDVMRGHFDTHGDEANNYAFYNNAEGTFKSRTNGRTAPDPQGSFNSASRKRNATRIPSRVEFLSGITLPPSTGPDNGVYQYPGVGDTTLRVFQSGNSFAGGDTFFTTGTIANTPGEFGDALFWGFDPEFSLFSQQYAWFDDVIINESTGTATITAHLNRPSAGTTNIFYSTESGTADAGQDFSTTSGFVTFNNGETSKTFVIPILNDNSAEGEEYFLVNGGFGQRAVVTILPDSDPVPSISISDTTVFPEGKDAVFTVTLSEASGVPIFVDYRTQDGTATDGADYLEQVNTVTFLPGETSKTIRINTLPDRLVEAPETFSVILSNPQSATIEDSQGVATIFDSALVELPTQVFANGYGTGTSTVEIKVTLSRLVPTGQTVTLNYQTGGGDATAGSDYVAANGSVVFNEGEDEKSIFITVNRDTVIEGDESFFVIFTDGGNAVFDDPTNTQVRVIIREPLDVVGADAGGGPNVRLFNGPLENVPEHSFFAFNPAFRGGVRVATGDMNGDGFPDIIVAAGPGGGPNVRIYDGVNLELINTFFGFPTAFRGGITVATGDVDGDGTLEIIVGADAGGGPAVRIFDAAGNQLGDQLLAFDAGFRGGVRVATGDVDGDGNDEIIVGSGPDQVSLVRVFDADDPFNITQSLELQAFADPFLGGVTVTAGDYDGNGTVEIIVGAGSGGGPNVRVFNGATGALLQSFFAFNPAFRGGIRVATANLHGGGADTIMVGAGPGGGPAVNYFRFNGIDFTNLGGYFGFNPAFRGGVFVAGRSFEPGTAGSPLHAFEAASPLTDAASPINQSDLAPIVNAALERFGSVGLNADLLQRLASVEFVIADLGGTLLGLSRPGVILIDDDAAGHGWFVDYSPMLDEEFGRNGSGTLTALDSRASGRMDLLTTVMHELGHELGWTDLQAAQHADDLMTGTLRTGVRRDLDSVFATEDLFDALLTA